MPCRAHSTPQWVGADNDTDRRLKRVATGKQAAPSTFNTKASKKELRDLRPAANTF